MNLIEKIHSNYVHGRRVHRLCELIAKQLPAKAKVLDVGAGDGWLDHLIQQTRPDVQIHGVDVLMREKTYIPVTLFDGETIPAPDHSYDVVLFVDVLHHTKDPMVLLREARRVMRHAIVIKDHNADGLFADATLRFMDRVGNRRHRVALPHNYWPVKKWTEAFDSLGLIVSVNQVCLKLYPWPASALFDRKLHFIARVEPTNTISSQT
jgi:SAM-dependent methyltransferase